MLSRLPVVASGAIDLGQLKHDTARRGALRVDVETKRGIVAVFGTHMSHLSRGSPLQFRRLRKELSLVELPSVLAGDMNLWGPPVNSYLRGWRRALTARTWPAYRPHSQLDHVLVTPPVSVLGARVGPFAGSDHLPVVVGLALT